MSSTNRDTNTNYQHASKRKRPITISNAGEFEPRFERAATVSSIWKSRHPEMYETSKMRMIRLQYLVQNI